MGLDSNYSSSTFPSVPLPVRYLVSAVRKVPFVRRVWKLYQPLFRAPGELTWRFSLKFQRARLRLSSDSRIDKATKLLTADNLQENPECHVTFGVTSRKLGNRDNHLATMLDSFSRLTTYPERFEFLIKIDDDDDVPFFLGVKRKFPKLNLRFFVTPRGRGYPDLHIYLSFLLDYASPSTKAWQCITDDALFLRNGWDLDIYELIDSGLNFAIGPKPFNLMAEIGGLEPYRYGTFTDYDCDEYCIVSWSLIEGLRAATKDMDGMTAMGDRFCADHYITNILHIIDDKHGLNLHHQIETHCIRYFHKVSLSRDSVRRDITSEAVAHFFEPDSFNTRTEIVDRMFAQGVFKNQPKILENSG